MMYYRLTRATPNVKFLHVENILPADGSSKDTSEDKADTEAEGTATGEDSEGARLFDLLGVGKLDQGEGVGNGCSSTETLHGTGDAEEDDTVGESTDEGPNREPDKSDQEEKLVAVFVTEFASDQEEGSKSQCKGIDDPGELALRKVEFSLDGREGNVDSGEVRNIDELGEAKDDEDDPLGG